jgi:hypothetical protein
MSNVEVCAAATAWDDPITGHTSVLEFHQGLWFGTKLPNSLVNPNQCRLFGISLCDDPFDPFRKLEMTDTETGTVIPLAMHGSTCHFRSRVPTKLELDTFPRIVMTSDELWDPASLFQQTSSEEEAHTRLASDRRSVTVSLEQLGFPPPREVIIIYLSALQKSLPLEDAFPVIFLNHMMRRTSYLNVDTTNKTAPLSISTPRSVLIL